MIIILIVSLIIAIIIVATEGISFGTPNWAKTPEGKTPKERFDNRTDKLWESASMMCGSFDKISEEKKNQIYNRMEQIANEEGYDGFKKENYIH